ncbi:UDP-N-acetylmuramoyl-L-alanine--D-glutamate ligase [Bacillus sp. FJAT-42376]|uniref:UDP-N-acetylmuramoyl-L-alanine--D-glutamate ligase n=1 Tax=Bacillus sp. FJAT-42376 TaxID=2014076 RepID=UPI000F4DACFD|nr:UDP-N-acetylmuramoyl-L-alanine--D-glutamate ligase [Bacillus sp. FJAT-42376]AZB42838.1 UDP-N-acetylmuramoyl-L-alanine--D-glutamate ligase [Bacillus sp. FJAT-42376]
MKTIDLYKGKSVLVLGLAKSGLAAAKLLQKLGASVTVNDMKPLDENEAARELQTMGIHVICGSHPDKLLEDRKIEMVVKNPGIPYSNPVLVQAAGMGIPVLTEVELAYQISEADIIGITGSNGKTTTTTLVFEMLKKDGKQPLIAGNIGTVACEVAEKAKPDQVIVMELSSFQLQGTETFKPSAAVVLNLFDAHLDYHGTKDAYAAAKGKIYENLTDSEIAVMNADDQEASRLGDASKGKRVYFSVHRDLGQGAFIKDEAIWYNDEQIISVKDIVLPGKHNLENILAAICLVKTRGCSNEAIRQVLTSFSGVIHRLQFVRNVKGRKFYNDSKATNILATSKALEAFEQPVILLAGGLDRGNGFDELKKSMKYVKALITFGETAPKLEKTAEELGIEVIKRVDNVEQAAGAAYDQSESGDIILLSPACASWDQYKTFEQRGDMFASAVHKLD